MIQTTNISLIPSDNKPVINVSQFDNVSRVLRFNVFDDAEMTVPHVFDNTETVLLNIRKNDNNIVVITGVIVSDIDPETQEILDQYLTFELTEQACACVGSNFGEVSITSGDDEVIGSCNFKLIVERSPLAGGVSSQTAIDNLTTQIEQITEEVIGENYYTKTETDNLLDGKADVSDLPDMTDYYTKTETDNLLDGKADISDLPDMTDYYTKTETDNLLDGKADVSDLPDMSDYYTKTETDNKIAALIDDSQTDNNKTWSSDKISDELYALLPVGTASGAVASFNTALAKPLVSCVVDENATMIYSRGGNLWDELWEVGGYNSSGNKNTVTDRIRCANKIAVHPSSSYYSTIRIRICEYDINGDFISQASSFVTGEFSVGPNTHFITFNTTDAYGTTYLNDLSINGNVSDTSYHPWNSNSTEYNVNDSVITLSGLNTIFADYGDITVQYKDTIQNYIDTRVNAVSNRSLSMLRTLETLEKSAELERGDNNENER